MYRVKSQFYICTYRRREVNIWRQTGISAFDWKCLNSNGLLFQIVFYSRTVTRNISYLTLTTSSYENCNGRLQIFESMLVFLYKIVFGLQYANTSRVKFSQRSRFIHTIPNVRNIWKCTSELYLCNFIYPALMYNIEQMRYYVNNMTSKLNIKLDEE